MSDDHKPLDPITLKNDQPVFGNGTNENDWLNFMPLARTVAGIAIGTDGPFTVGITAKWGSGKTSMLQMVKRLIEKEGANRALHDKGEFSATHICAWFNAWQFEREEEPIVPLLLAIREALADSEDQHKSFWDNVDEATIKTFRTMKNVLSAVASGLKINAKTGTSSWVKAMLGVDLSATLDVDLGKIRAALADIEKPDDKTPMPESTFIKALSELNQLSKDLIKESKDRDAVDHPKIVVFVDDLDRCHPDTALKLLDGIKLILDQPGFMFIIALDKTIVEEYLAKRYREEFNASNWHEVGQHYIDKLIQLEIPLPPASGRFAMDCNGTDKKGYVEQVAEQILEETYDPKIAEMLCLCPTLSPRDIVRLLLRVKIDISLWKEVNPEPLKRVSERRVEPGKQREPGQTKFLYDNEINLAAMLTRLIEYAFDAPHRGDFIELVESDHLCQLVSQECQTNLKSKQLSLSGLSRAVMHRTDLQNSVLATLSRLRGLKDVIDRFGALWLAHTELRNRLLKFLDPSREQTRTNQGDYDIVVEAIRKSLGLREGEVQPEHWAQVRELDLSGCDI
jgi:hypothetical protein